MLMPADGPLSPSPRANPDNKAASKPARPTSPHHPIFGIGPGNAQQNGHRVRLHGIQFVSDRLLVGPSGELFAPFGELTEEAAINGFSEQIRGLVDGGVDILWIETMSAEEELKCAIKAGKKFNIPMICTYSFDTHGKSMMGLEPKDLVRIAESFYPAVVGYGANCGIGASELIGTMICLEKERKNKSMYLVAKANCGIPEFVDGEIKYTGTPKLMAKYADLAKTIGINIIGGCCGTKAEHINAMSQALKHTLDPAIDIKSIVKLLGEISTGNIKLINSYLNPEININSAVKKKTRRRKK